MQDNIQLVINLLARYTVCTVHGESKKLIFRSLKQLIVNETGTRIET